MKKFYLPILIIAMFLTAFAIYQAKPANANPDFFCEDRLNAASTTLTFMTPGTATTTHTYENCGGTTSARSAILFFQYTASTTDPLLNLRIEHSQDNIDWYPASVALEEFATSTSLTGDSATFDFTTLATSTNNNGGTGTDARLHRSLEIETPTQFTRVIFSLPIGTSNGAIWSQFVSKKELP